MPTPASLPAPSPTKKPSPAIWVSSTYFAEGFPYMIARWLSGVFLTKIGMKETWIGYANWLGVFWNLKFLWAPLLDAFSSKRRFVIGCEIGLFVCALLLAFLSIYGPPTLADASVKLTWADLVLQPSGLGQINRAEILVAMGCVFVLFSFLSATHDVAIDGHYLEHLSSAQEEAAYSGLRALFYRIAVIFTKLAFIGFTSWFYGFLQAAGVLLVIVVWHVFFLPAPRLHAARVDRNSLHQIKTTFLAAFWSFVRQPRMGIILLFIVAYKLGDEVLFAMNTPFFLRELGVSSAQYAWLSGVVGTLAFIFASMLGGWLISRYGLGRAIWPMTLLMNGAIWAYVYLAWAKPNPAHWSGMAWITGVHALESLASGVGSAALTVFLMSVCRPPYRSTHYAIGSAWMTMGGTIMGGFSGSLVEHIGYFSFYVVAFFCSLPSMILLPFVPIAAHHGLSNLQKTDKAG